MATHAPGGPAPLHRAAIVGLFLVNLVPLIALLPDALPLDWTARLPDWYTSAQVPAQSLLPVVTLPTVVLAARAGRRVYRGQLVVAGLICLATVLLAAGSASAVVTSAIATIGTLVFIVLLIERSRRALAESRRHLRAAGHSDSLTGVLNRRGAVAELGRLVAAARAGQRPIGVAAIDLDHFKRINDDRGHAAGDATLRRVAVHAQQAVGRDGLAVRSGGEELLLITVGDPGVAAKVLMERLRDDPTDPPVTVSIGTVSVRSTDGFGADDLWAAADQADAALYRAKVAGRNRIVDGGEYASASTPHGSQRGHAAGPGRAAETTSAAGSFDALGSGPSSKEMTTKPMRDGGWRAAVDGARHRPVTRDLHLLYRLIVGWMMVVGMMATLPEALAGNAEIVQLAVMLPLGWVFGAGVIFWMGRLRTSWALTPVFVGGVLFETVVVFSVAVPTRPSALMLALLAGLLMIGHWPQRFAMAPQLALALVACCGAALVPDRSPAAVVVIAATTGAALTAALAVVAALHRASLRAEAVLHRIAATDPLTRLANRRALAEAAERWSAGWIVMVDIDEFKSINDRFGHGYGDAVLHTLARELEAAASQIDPRARAFRIGGDEFVVAGPGEPPAAASATDGAPSDDTSAGRSAAAVRAFIDQERLPTSVSIGAATWRASVAREPEPTDLWAALAAADQRMLGQKQSRSANRYPTVRRPRR